MANDKEKRYICAEWRVPIHGKLFLIEFQHGTTSGKRVISVNRKEVIRRDWMFKLVGEDVFSIEDVKCIIKVSPVACFKYNYQLYVNGKSYEKYFQNHEKIYKTWMANINDYNFRVLMEKHEMNVYLNGVLQELKPEFVDGGTDTHFSKNGISFILSARSSGDKHLGIVYSLTANGQPILESTSLN